jgi:hypothetical protein
MGKASPVRASAGVGGRALQDRQYLENRINSNWLCMLVFEADLSLEAFGADVRNERQQQAN